MDPFSTHSKHQKTLLFFAFFGGKRNGALGTNGLTDYFLIEKMTTC